MEITDTKIYLIRNGGGIKVNSLVYNYDSGVRPQRIKETGRFFFKGLFFGSPSNFFCLEKYEVFLTRDGELGP